jgi:hypothetical protein
MELSYCHNGPGLPTGCFSPDMDRLISDETLYLVYRGCLPIASVLYLLHAMGKQPHLPIEF